MDKRGRTWMKEDSFGCCNYTDENNSDFYNSGSGHGENILKGQLYCGVSVLEEKEERDYSEVFGLCD